MERLKYLESSNESKNKNLANSSFCPKNLNLRIRILLVQPDLRIPWVFENSIFRIPKLLKTLILDAKSLENSTSQISMKKASANREYDNI